LEERRETRKRKKRLKVFQVGREKNGRNLKQRAQLVGEKKCPKKWGGVYGKIDTV